MRWTLSTLVALLALLPASAEAARIGEPGSPTPNVILIVTDDQDPSQETVSKMPYLHSRTPQGGGGWYRFDRAFINNAVCCPSRATILSGQWSHHTGVENVAGAPAFDDADTVATRLDDAGYRTGWIGKYHLGPLAGGSPTYVPPGWDYFADARANDHPDGDCESGNYYNWNLNENGTLHCYGTAPEDYSTDVLREKARAFINAAADPGQRPFFLTFAPRGPHNPWTPAPRHEGTYADEPVPFPPSWNEDTSDKPTWWADRPEVRASNREASMRKEWTALLAVDDAVEVIHKRVVNLGLMDETVILYMSDNGYSFGEHRWAPKRCIYDPCARTPLYAKYGEASEGWTFPEVVGNEDIASTVLDIAGELPDPDSDGQSFEPMLQNHAAPPGWQNEALLRVWRPAADVGQPPVEWAIRTPEYLYGEVVDTGETELYDLALDPFQLTNVADEPSYSMAQAELDARLDVLRALP